MDGPTLPKLRFTTLGVSLTVQKPFTDEELLNTYEEIFPLMDQVRTLVLAEGDKTTVDELQSTFTGTLLGEQCEQGKLAGVDFRFWQEDHSQGCNACFLGKGHRRTPRDPHAAVQ